LVVAGGPAALWVAPGDMPRMGRTALALLMMSGIAACRFDGGGIAPADDVGDDDVGDDDSGGVDADVTPPPDAAPGHPDAMPPPQPAAGLLIAKPAHGPVTLDGDDDEFDEAGAMAVTWPIQGAAIYQRESQSYVASAAARVAAIHDHDAIYFYVEVDDVVQQFDSSEVWNDDGVSLFLDVAGDASGIFGIDDHEIVVRGDGLWKDYGPGGALTALSGEAIPEGGGYRMELRIAKDSLGATVGEDLGFDLLVTDDDGWNDNRYDALGVWFASSRPECETCCLNETQNMPWCDTTLFGTLRLD